MNLKNKVKELINISCLNEICNVLPYEDKDIYLIGGATRSILSDKYEIKDIDLVIPDLDSFTVDKILDKYDDAKYYPGYKSISLVFNDFEYQINSFRKDIAPSGRHSKVAKATSIKEDSLRRDFTFNSVYINLKGDVYDFYLGIEHYQNSYLEFIFDPIVQIQKDYLRAIRYMRFLSLFENTKTFPADMEAITILSKNITDFVKEKKITQELNKIQKMPFPENTISFLKKNSELNHLIDFLN